MGEYSASVVHERVDIRVGGWETCGLNLFRLCGGEADMSQDKKSKSYLVGVDSDGCVFDTMEIKQKGCFTRNTVRYFCLQSIFRAVCETSEFVNLYSRHRGKNRFLALLKVFELLEDHPQVLDRNVDLPDMSALREWTERESQLGNAALEAEVKANGDALLSKTLDWSLQINRDITDLVVGVGPFAGAREALEAAKHDAELCVVSQTPCEALVREWDEHGLDGLINRIYGQEDGTKDQHLLDARGDEYEDDHVLMLGDALGDLEAARKAGALFFPIVPGEEEKSWKRFLQEGFARFVTGSFVGDYQESLLETFMKKLPVDPPWMRM
jgi:phosphoglycolate phosphatase-like HAD superfamily hydrolase